MTAALAKGELTGVDRIIPGVCRALLTSALKSSRQGSTEHPGTRGMCQRK
jgi:hypothetical protein